VVPGIPLKQFGELTLRTSEKFDSTCEIKQSVHYQ